MGFPSGVVVKNPSANAGDVRDVGLIRGLGRSSGEGNGNSNILAWRIPWTEELDGLHTVYGVSKSQTRLKRLSTHTHMIQLFHF